MATIPLILSLANEFDRLTSSLTPYYNYWPASRPLSLTPKEKYTSALIGKDGFQVSMDVTQFKPNELNVKVVDNCIVVEGKHEEREDDHGYISRHFVRRYALPKGYEANKVMSTLSSDGVLTVSAPKPQLEDKSNERVVQIQQTGPAHLNIKDNPQENNDKDKDNDKDKEKDKKAKK